MELIGILKTDFKDGDSNWTRGTNIYHCEDCGCPVSDIDQHIKWHRRLTSLSLGFGVV